MGSLAADSWTHASPHVVVAPNAHAGHAIPFLEFARHLAAHGVETTVVTSDRHVAELRRTLGATDWTTDAGVPLRIVGLRDGKVELTHREWSEALRESDAERGIVKLMREVVEALSPPPVCVVHDMFVMWAQEVADALGIQKHLLFTSSAATVALSLQTMFPGFAGGLIPISKEHRDAVVSDIPGVPPIPALDLPGACFDAALYEQMRTRHKQFFKADVILVNTFYELEKSPIDALRNEVLKIPNMQSKSILDIGPLLLPEPTAEDTIAEADDDPCIRWLNTRPVKSVLYVSFGSAATHPVAQLEEIASGLEASGCAFLWIVRPPSTPSMSPASEHPGSVTEFLPPGFEERMRDRGMCYSGWAAQTRILKHAAVGGFLSHCGWNSTLESVCAGVPILAWPKGAEQHFNRRNLVDVAKVAMELKANPYTTEELASDVVRPESFYSRQEIAIKVRSLMMCEAEGQAVRNNIQSLAAAACEAGKYGGTSRTNFEAYVCLLHSYGNYNPHINGLRSNGENNGQLNGHNNGHSNGHINSQGMRVNL